MEGDKYRKKLRFVLKFFSKQKFVFYETRFLPQEEREKRCALSNSARAERYPVVSYLSGETPPERRCCLMTVESPLCPPSSISKYAHTCMHTSPTVSKTCSLSV